MNQKRKNIRQLIYMAILLVVTVAVAIIGRDHDGFDYDKAKFALDENTVITTVVLEGNNFKNRFEYVNGTWQVNDKYEMDQGMRDVFFALLSKVEVQRPVSTVEQDSLAAYLLERGVKISVLNNTDTVKTYLVGGDEEKFQSYFMDFDERLPFLVHIPGYQSFISGIFNATENDWRNRYIWDIDWTSLKKLIVNSREEQDSLVFEYKNNFIGVDGIEDLDTAGMMGYLENIAYLQTDKYLEPGEIPVYEQVVSDSEPTVVIKVEQIGNRMSSLQFYPQPDGKLYIPAVLNDNQLVLFQPSILESILLKPSDFELRD